MKEYHPQTEIVLRTIKDAHRLGITGGTPEWFARFLINRHGTARKAAQAAAELARTECTAYWQAVEAAIPAIADG